MKRFLAWALIAIVVVCFLQTAAIAQSWPTFNYYDEDDIHYLERGPGGYLSWWKLLVCTLVFLFWIKSADWINRDSQLMHGRTKMTAEVWNPFVVGLFLVGFLCVLSIPFFAIGCAVYTLTAAIPFLIYVVARNSKVRENETAFTFSHLRRLMGKEKPLIEMPEEEEKGPPLEIEAAGKDENASASNMIRARRTQMFDAVKNMMFEAISRRASLIVLEYTQQAVSGKMQVDGIFHPLPPMDRGSGDAMLVSLKHLADVNPADRQNRQQGAFISRIGKEKFICEFVSQGVQTGERVTMKFPARKKTIHNLGQLGFWEDSIQKLSTGTNSPGLVIISAMPQGGLTSTWQATILNADRITRDWIGVIDHDEQDTELENVELTRIDSRKGETISGVLPSLLLKQPDGVVAPKFVNKASADLLMEQAVSNSRTVLTRMPARTAAEAILRVMSTVGDRKKFIQALSVVTCQRLVRRLCENCKQLAPANPQLIQRLGGDPNQPVEIYSHFQMPNPLPVDDKGVPIEIATCKVCGGLGYIGMIGVYEMIVVDDALRRGIAQQPDLPTITKLAIERGNRSLAQEGYRLVLAGITSIAEIQRVLQQAN